MLDISCNGPQTALISWT